MVEKKKKKEPIEIRSIWDLINLVMNKTSIKKISIEMEDGREFIYTREKKD